MKYLISSQGQGVMLRIKSFLILAIPYIVTYLSTLGGRPLENQPVIDFVNSAFVVFFGIIQAWAWIRSIWYPKQVQS